MSCHNLLSQDLLSIFFNIAIKMRRPIPSENMGSTNAKTRKYNTVKWKPKKLSDSAAWALVQTTFQVGYSGMPLY